MTKDLAAILSVGEEKLLDEFKAVHQRYGNSEQPFATADLSNFTPPFHLDLQQ